MTRTTQVFWATPIVKEHLFRGYRCCKSEETYENAKSTCAAISMEDGVRGQSSEFEISSD